MDADIPSVCIGVHPWLNGSMPISDKVKERLQQLPDKPGVYVMRDRQGKIIYIGKAASLRSRVRHYFQAATLRSADPKLRGLINSVDDFEFIVVRSEAEAVLTEGRLIKEYRPRYNVFFKDDKRFLMLRVDLRASLPRFETCRFDRKDGATYFGPYATAISARAALEFIEKRFGIRQCRPLVPGPDDHRHCHNDIVRFCSAPCIAKITPEAYRERVDLACAFLRGERPEDLVSVEETMRKAAAEHDFEKAAAMRDMLLLLRKAVRERAKGLKSLELRNEEARAGLLELQAALNLAAPPRLIECFDISNISGTNAVASMVVAVDGVPYPQRYRRFRIKGVEGSDVSPAAIAKGDDPAMMAEVIRRRYTRVRDEDQERPGLVLVDGGVTQLSAARAELEALGMGDLPSAGLAKRFEELHWNTHLALPPIRLPANSAGLKVIQRLRDEAHRFALTYHRKLRARRIRESALDDIEGLGEKRKELLLAHFGSVTRLRRATVENVMDVPGIGRVTAEQILARLARTAKP
jgi:excinuclease ABC subunit C